MIRNVSVTSALNIYRSVIQFALNIALAQFLVPADLGQVAYVLPITLLILLLGDFGITAAIVRSAATARQAGAAAALCVGYGLAIGGGIALLYLVGAFSGWPGQTPELLLVFGLVALIAMAAIVPRAMLERSLSYSRLAIVETIANTSAFAAAVFAAWLGAGAWSLAVYHLTMQTLRGVLFWIDAGNRVEFNLDWRQAMPLMMLGGWVVAFNLVNYLARNFDNYIIGGLLGTAELGLYAMAYQVMLVPMMAIAWPASAVLLSTLGRLRDHPDLQRHSFVAMLGLGATVTFPLMAFVALRGDLVFSLLLPPRWHDIGPVVSRLAIAGGLQSSTAFLGVLFLLHGRVRAQFAMGAVATTLVLTMVSFSAWYWRSLVAVADAYVAVTVLLSFLYYVVMARLLGTGLGPIFGALVPGVVMVLVASAATLLVELTLPADATLLLRIAVDIVTYGAAALVLLALRWTRLKDAFSALRSAGVQAAG